MANNRIREAAKIKGVMLWEIAEKLCINDSNFSRRLRRDLPPEQTAKILAIIDEISDERRGKDGRHEQAENG